jgi:CheY-like chemotaxis protein
MDADDAPLVLVVDDSRDVAESLAALCESAGCRTGLPAKGEPVHEAVRRLRPKAVILDILMPEPDGFEVLGEIARIDPALPILLVSGAGDSWLRMGEKLGRARGLRVIHTQSKPVAGRAVRQFLSGVLPAAPA